MNIKYTVKNEGGRILSCVLDAEKELDLQLEEVMGISHGYGIGVNVRENEIEVTDYYHASSMASFKILCREETKEPLSLKWTEMKIQS